jgi:hypothetical protein
VLDPTQFEVIAWRGALNTIRLMRVSKIASLTEHSKLLPGNPTTSLA